MSSTREDMGGAYIYLRGLTEVIWWMMLAGAAISLLIMALGTDGTWHRTYPVGVELDPDAYEISPLTETGAAPTLTDLKGSLSVPGFRPDGLLLGAAWFAIVLFVVKTVRDIVRSLDKRPFAPANASRIGRIGWILLALAVLNTFSGSLQSALLDVPILTRGVTLTFPNSFELTDYVYPLLILVLAQVFRHGTQIETDQELTV